MQQWLLTTERCGLYLAVVLLSHGNQFGLAMFQFSFQHLYFRLSLAPENGNWIVKS